MVDLNVEWRNSNRREAFHDINNRFFRAQRLFKLAVDMGKWKDEREIKAKVIIYPMVTVMRRSFDFSNRISQFLHNCYFQELLIDCQLHTTLQQDRAFELMMDIIAYEQMCEDISSGDRTFPTPMMISHFHSVWF
jgi:hypothetical protein